VEHDISETLLRRWRDQLVEAGAESFQARQISRQAINRVPKRTPRKAPPMGPAVDVTERAIIEVAQGKPDRRLPDGHGTRRSRPARNLRAPPDSAPSPGYSGIGSPAFFCIKRSEQALAP
jgi:transposase-like protein